ADRACTSVLQTVDASGTSGRPTSDLPAGEVFWRLFGRQGTDVGVESSPTWQVHIGVRTAPVDTSWGTTLDINGDGYADVVVGASNMDIGTDDVTGSAYIYLGSAVGIASTPSVSLIGPDGTGG